MRLESEFIYRVKTTGPLSDTKGSPRGEQLYWIVSEAELGGRPDPRQTCRARQRLDERQQRRLLATRCPLAIRYRRRRDDLDALHGPGRADSRVQESGGNQSADPWDDQYMRLMMKFDTGAPRYRSFNTSLFVARGR